MITFRKGDGVKFVSSESTLIPILKATGWVADGEAEQEEAVPPRRGRPPKIQEID